MSIQLPADEGARFLSAFDAAADAKDEGATRADALVTITESFLASGASAPAGRAPYDVVVHVTAEALKGKTDGAFIHNHDGPAISAETSRRLACDAAVTEVVRGRRGAVLDVGRKTRTIPAAMRRALEVRDEHCCTFSGCHHRRYLDAHHAVHWADGGETKLGNTALVCRRHHCFLHEHGWRLEVADDGHHRWFDENDRLVPSAPAPQPSHEDTEHWRHRATDDDVSAELLATQGWYEKVDAVEVIDALATATIATR